MSMEWKQYFLRTVIMFPDVPPSSVAQKMSRHCEPFGWLRAGSAKQSS